MLRDSPSRIISPIVAMLVSLTAVMCVFAQAGHHTASAAFPLPGSIFAEAQTSFLQGLAQLHNFEYETAAEDFRKAQTLDPNFAMAYWGEAMANNHPVWAEQNKTAGKAVLLKLGESEDARLAKCGTDRERDYVRAVDILYLSNGTKYERDFKYADAMAKLYQKYPDDTDAGAFYALAILGTAHDGRDFSIYMRALAILEPLFYTHPNHPGVNHYLIHSVDDPIHAPLGLAAARNYSKIALDAPHAQHMTSHIYVALGMWDDVVQSNLSASRIENAQNDQRGRPHSLCGHYTSWLEYGYLEQGRIEDAKQVLTKCRDAALAAYSAKSKDYPGIVDYYASMRTRYLLDSEDWAGEIAHMSLVTDGEDDAELAATFAFADGFAAVRRGQLALARKAEEKVTAAINQENTPPLPLGTSPSPDMKRLTILQHELEAMLEAAEGKHDQAVDLLRQASSEEVAMPFEFGPPFIDKPTEELLGEILLAANRPPDAKAAFDASLARAPERTQSLVGLYRALKASGDTDGSSAVLTKLRLIWHNADHIPTMGD